MNYQIISNITKCIFNDNNDYDNELLMLLYLKKNQLEVVENILDETFLEHLYNVLIILISDKKLLYIEHIFDNYSHIIDLDFELKLMGIKLTLLNYICDQNIDGIFEKILKYYPNFNIYNYDISPFKFNYISQINYKFILENFSEYCFTKHNLVELLYPIHNKKIMDKIIDLLFENNILDHYDMNDIIFELSRMINIDAIKYISNLYPNLSLLINVDNCFQIFCSGCYEIELIIWLELFPETNVHDSDELAFMNVCEYGFYDTMIFFLQNYYIDVTINNNQVIKKLNNNKNFCKNKMYDYLINNYYDDNFEMFVDN